MTDLNELNDRLHALMEATGAEIQPITQPLPASALSNILTTLIACTEALAKRVADIEKARL